VFTRLILEGQAITDFVFEEATTDNVTTPGLSHFWVLKQLDKTGLSHWLLGFGSFIILTIAAIVMLIVVRYPDPDMYKNSIAFTAISSFFLVFYFAMGRGWHADVISFLSFDQSLESELSIIRPTRPVVTLEFVLIALCVAINVQVNTQVNLEYSALMFISILAFYFIQWALIVFSADVAIRQIICLMRIARKIRIDLLNAEFYSTMANVMVRFVGLYIFGVCIILLSNIVFTEGALSAGEMMMIMMPWYLPGLIIISLYLFPYNRFRKRMRSRKSQELNCVSAALDGNLRALDHSLLKDELSPSKIDLLYYQDRIRSIKEWPFTDRIRALVLFGILPPLTWVVAALIEIYIESAL